MSDRLAALAGLPVAAAPVARREFPLAAFVLPEAGQASVGNQGSGFRELDTTDPTARMMLRAGIGQTVEDTGRLYRLATDAAGFAGTTPMRGISAWHGSPEIFDRFDVSRARTGNAYGLWFADNPSRARIAGARHLYEVRLNVDPADLLDFGAPVARQARALEALEPLIRRGVDFFGHQAPQTGYDAYNVARFAAGPLDASRLGVRREAVPSELLRRAGIVGARSPDGPSALNYVMFDGAPVEILRREALE